MRIKTTITLPEDLLAAIDQAADNRSAFLEKAARAQLARLKRAARDAQDLQIYESHVQRLNKEAQDVLGYQGWR
jgi:metal-responsive CopG/Arc/MetJ family transcriptional regulator